MPLSIQLATVASFAILQSLAAGWPRSRPASET
jgi:hypothetical protein